MKASPSAADRVEHLLSAPPPLALEAVRQLGGDFTVLGVGGKMGTTVALMLRRTLDAIGQPHRTVTGVSRFTRSTLPAELSAQGIHPVACDLSDAQQVSRLPSAENVIFLAGQKFGTDSSPGSTWVQNTIVPTLVAQHYAGARLVAFSTGCVYPFVPVNGPGASESDPVAFLGEYASSCVARERLFTHYAGLHDTRLLLFRLNYSVELRYGVLVDIAAHVHRGNPVDVTTGWFNCIWQGDACARAIASLQYASSPVRILNVTGPEKLSVRAVATEFGRLLGRAPVFVGREAETAWLADASESIRLFGPPTVSVSQMMTQIADYLRTGGELLGKPTHFESRTGTF
ncbi:NAD-dependent epimerase/dehydratase family protein [Opitutus terrae]|uniref:NAD-dependent epimerase/dehydratase n=1 Tax=Opitutus terrae (strain DSM 11246 / JCM 15787 / PB90-1) TaxID=452637 RepID=B1ZY53_OPITP|nr:NAD-dependent epimerase/dehydratase family protein [Opitutus terrae]ACB76202.1 NAD-dependent epimerase/dehydratase [Opitutus terrae PB90-1]